MARRTLAQTHVIGEPTQPSVCHTPPHTCSQHAPQHQVPIPVWNDQDECDTIQTMMEAPPDFPSAEAGVDDATADFTYITDYE